METTEERAVRRVSFDISTELYHRLKIVALQNEMTVKEILNGLVKAWVEKKEAQ